MTMNSLHENALPLKIVGRKVIGNRETLYLKADIAGGQIYTLSLPYGPTGSGKTTTELLTDTSEFTEEGVSLTVVNREIADDYEQLYLRDAARNEQFFNLRLPYTALQSSESAWLELVVLETELRRQGKLQEYAQALTELVNGDVQVQGASLDFYCADDMVPFVITLTHLTLTQRINSARQALAIVVE